jgi:hypothetical protein
VLIWMQRSGNSRVYDAACKIEIYVIFIESILSYIKEHGYPDCRDSSKRRLKDLDTQPSNRNQ